MCFLSSRFIKVTAGDSVKAAIILTLFWCGYASAAIPAIQAISDQSVNQGEQLVVPVRLTNPNEAGTVNWSKAYGPDDVKINPLSGAVTWQVPADLPGESFHIGVRASNLEGASIDSFIVHVGVNRVVYIGPNEDVKHFLDAFAQWREPGSTMNEPGITFVVRNGEYEGKNWEVGLTSSGGVQILPTGTPTQYTTLMAEDPGQVIFREGKLMAQGNLGDVSYWAIKGFHLEAGAIGADGSGCNNDESCKPHHIKFIQNGVNMTHFRSSFGAGLANHILFENNYAYGGYRVKFLAYKSKYTIFRRNVGRFDHNEDHTGPKNTFSFYSAMDISAQNNIAIDADQMEFIDSGELAGEFGCPTTSGSSRAEWDRNIQLNSDMLHTNFDQQNGSCYAITRDRIGWDVRPGLSFFATRSPSLIEHATFGNIYFEDDPLVVFNGWPGRYARGIRNSIIHNVNKGPLFEGFTLGTTTDLDNNEMQRYGIEYVNLTGFTGALRLNSTTINEDTMTSVDPIWSRTNPNGGLRYLVRIEPNSNLSGKAADGGDLGATVMTFKGKSGTMWGEDGYDEETNVPAWPFPYQETIAEKMRAMVHTGPTWIGSWQSRVPGPEATLSGNRGFARPSTNLTDYIWGYMGSTVPPMNVNATGTPESAVIRWDPSAPNASITGYKVYDYNPTTKTISNPRNVGLVNSTTIENLTNGETYHFAVTTIDRTTGESSYSYPVSVTPKSRPNPLPPTVRQD